MKTQRRRGVALLIVLWLSAILTLLMYAFLTEMKVEYALAGGFADQKKAEQLAWSAIDAACAYVETEEKTWHALPDLWADDDQRFFEVPLGDGAYSVFRPLYNDQQDVNWGLDDEASKVNLNTASREILMKLPRMTAEIADAIIDWRDQDSTPGPSGAEDAVYQTLQTPYKCKNQPFETVEELLYVRGVTPEVLYGEDVNLNGRLEDNENDGDDSWPPDNRDGRIDPGLWPLVTVWSADRNLTNDGQARINLNTPQAYTTQQLNAAGVTSQDMQVASAYMATRGPLPSVAHLLTHADGRGLFTGLPPERLKLIADKVTVTQEEVVLGLVNVNTAPKQVLLALPGITEEIALQIIGYRAPPGNDLSNIGWLVDVVDPQVLVQFAAFIATRSYQFRVHAVGRVGTPSEEMTGSETERPRAFRRMVAVFDRMAEPRPRLVYWKDQTRLGMPYDPAEDPYPNR